MTRGAPRLAGACVDDDELVALDEELLDEDDAVLWCFERLWLDDFCGFDVSVPPLEDELLVELELDVALVPDVVAGATRLRCAVAAVEPEPSPPPPPPLPTTPPLSTVCSEEPGL